jgi:hypothetical protein
MSAPNVLSERAKTTVNLRAWPDRGDTTRRANGNAKGHVMAGMTELQERGALNQARYREHNERIEAHNRMHHWVDPPMPDWICECAYGDCAEPVRMTIAEYEAVRAEPTHFLVAPSSDHVLEPIENVVARHDRYWIVEKDGRAGEVSEELDPRDD